MRESPLSLPDAHTRQHPPTMESTVELNQSNQFVSPKAAISLLKVMKEAAGAIPLIGTTVQGGIGALIEVLSIISKIRGNKEQLETLLNRINDVLNALHPIIPSGAGKSLSRGPLLFRIEKLTIDLHACSAPLRRLQSYGWFDRLSQQEAISEDIEKIQGVIDGAMETFHLDGTIAREAILYGSAIKVDEINAKPDAAPQKGMQVVRAAFTDSSATVCLDGTRVDLLQDLRDWAHENRHPERRFAWLKGPPGSGKSTVARTIATEVHNDGLLAASFFFSRDHLDRRNAYSVFPSIARQLAEFSPEFREIAIEIKKKYPDGDILGLEAQLERFIAEPLRQMPAFDKPWAVVMDALDECDNQEAASEILSLLGFHHDRLPHIRILITSRPEHHIASQLSKSSLESHSHTISLYEIDRLTGFQDVRRFLESELNDTWARRERWTPSNDDLQSLVDVSGGLFIYASTCVKLLTEAPNKIEMLRRLTEIGQDGNVSSVQRLNSLYVRILESISNSSSEESIKTLGRILGAIVHLRDTLSLQALASLLYVDKELILSTLRPLQSVILMPDSEADSICFYHQSFRDFLLTHSKRISSVLPSSQSNTIHAKLSFYDQSSYDSYLAEDCFKTFNVALHHNMSGVDNLTVLNADIPNLNRRLALNLPPHVRYACLRWASHVSTSYPIRSSSVCNLLEDWARTKIMFWLESLSLCGELEQAVTSLSDAEKWYEQCPTPADDVLQLLKDGQQFVQTFFEPIESGAGHIYRSALPFTPDSTLRRQYGDLLAGSMKVLQGRHARRKNFFWSAGEHANLVSSVAFSPDGRRIVSGSLDEMVRLWSSETGKLLSTLKGHTDSVTSVAFSPDGRRIVSGSLDETVRLWSSETGRLLSTLKGHTGLVYSVVFSPDGTLIGSGSMDKIVRVWSSETGAQLFILRGHTDSVRSVAFSPDGRLIVSGSIDKTVLVWSLGAGKLLYMLVGHTRSVYSVAFSPDGRRIVSGSLDGAVRLLSLETGRLLSTLKGHTDSVYSAVFSPDGKQIVSASMDGTVRLWSSETGRLLSTLKGHTGLVYSVAFSPDGKRIGSGSLDGTVWLWSSETRKLLSTLKGHADSVYSVVFSLDGKVIGSGSLDGAVQLWSLETGKLLFAVKGRRDSVYEVTLSPGRSYLFSTSNRGRRLQWHSGAAEVGNGTIGDSDGIETFHYEDNGWVTAEGYPLCWIPFRNRPTSKKALASRGLILCIGDEDGAVTILDFSSMFVATT